MRRTSPTEETTSPHPVRYPYSIVSAGWPPLNFVWATVNITPTLDPPLRDRAIRFGRRGALRFIKRKVEIWETGPKSRWKKKRDERGYITLHEIRSRKRKRNRKIQESEAYSVEFTGIPFISIPTISAASIAYTVDPIAVLPTSIVMENKFIADEITRNMREVGYRDVSALPPYTKGGEYLGI